MYADVSLFERMPRIAFFSRRGVTNECNANKLPKISISIKPNRNALCASSSCSNLENKHEIYSLAQQTAASEQKELQQPAETEKEPEKSAVDPEIILRETKETENKPIPIEVEDKPLEIESKETEKIALPETRKVAAINNNPPVIDQIRQLSNESNPLKQILQAEFLIKRENHSPGPRTITAQLLSGGSNSGLRHEEKRPKSVTASVFRPSSAPPLTPTSVATPPPPPAAVLCKKNPLHSVEPTLPPTTTATAAIISSSNQQLQIPQPSHLQNTQQPAQDMNKGFCSLFADDGRGLTSKYPNSFSYN